MNLNSVVSGPISAINPFTMVTYYASAGAVKNADHTRSPTFLPFPDIPVQIQPLGTNDIEHIDGLNLQKVNSVAYLNGHIAGLDRRAGQGGDMMSWVVGEEWLVTGVIENFDSAGWTKVVITKQASKS